MENKKFELHTISCKELAQLYSITTRALRYRLKPYMFMFSQGKRKTRFLPNELEFIFSKFGNPTNEK